MSNSQLFLGDCLDVMRGMEPNSIHSIVCDPPYGLKFMGKHWDHGVPGVAFWEAALRVVKPGAMLLAFGGTRTFHRLTVAIEDAGWEIRDCLMWLYGSGFPKSHNLGNGWGTALKPAWEPIIMAMKPLDGTYANNALVHGVAGINVDASRIGTTQDDLAAMDRHKNPTRTEWVSASPDSAYAPNIQGRWPANLLLDDEAAALLDQMSGVSKSGVAVRRNGNNGRGTFPVKIAIGSEDSGYSDSGGASRFFARFAHDEDDAPSRFFYCAKASKRDRDEGLEGIEPRVGKRTQAGGDDTRGQPLPINANTHPTVKPTQLMRYLVRLVTPSGGTTLDPFCGSGSTGKAAVLEGFNFVGIDTEAEYLAIAECRIAHAQTKPSLLGTVSLSD